MAANAQGYGHLAVCGRISCRKATKGNAGAKTAKCTSASQWT